MLFADLACDVDSSVEVGRGLGLANAKDGTRQFLQIVDTRLCVVARRHQLLKSPGAELQSQVGQTNCARGDAAHRGEGGRVNSIILNDPIQELFCLSWLSGTCVAQDLRPLDGSDPVKI